MNAKRQYGAKDAVVKSVIIPHVIVEDGVKLRPMLIIED